MRADSKTVYTAIDGEIFLTRDECVEYEKVQSLELVHDAHQKFLHDCQEMPASAALLFDRFISMNGKAIVAALEHHNRLYCTCNSGRQAFLVCQRCTVTDTRDDDACDVCSRMANLPADPLDALEKISDWRELAASALTNQAKQMRDDEDLRYDADMLLVIAKALSSE